MNNPDFPKIAEAYGIEGRKVTKREELDDAIEEMLKDNKAYLLEVEVEENGMVYPMIPAGTSVDQIILGD